MNTRIIAEDVCAILDQDGPWTALAGRRFLVTGATGMVGQYLVRVLMELGRRTTPTHVVAMTRRGDAAANLFASEGHGLEILVHDPAQALPALGGLDYLVHAASPADPEAFRQDPVGVISANVAGTAHLLEAARARDAVFCFVSSAEVYGQAQAAEGRLDEAAPGVLDSLDLRSAYPESKRLAETLCVAYGHQYGTSHRIARLAHTYGPGMRLSDPRVQTYLMRQALYDRDIELQSDGRALRSYTYVSDAVSGLLHLLAAPGNQVCNIANASATVSIADLARTVLRCCPGSRSRLMFACDPGRAPAPTVTPPLLDCTRLKALGWAPRVDLETGLGRTLQHHRYVLADAARAALRSG